MIEERPGFAAIRIAGKGADVFAEEAGGHRFQRVPPNEKRGRIHTSTITVAVLPEPTEVQVVVREDELEVKYCRGSGAGGQHRNVTDSACVITHVPTGISVRSENSRSQPENRETAMAVLRARLWQTQHERVTGQRADARRAQVGSGQRGDKTWSIDVPEDRVTHHATGRRWRFHKEYARGNW